MTSISSQRPCDKHPLPYICPDTKISHYRYNQRQYKSCDSIIAKQSNAPCCFLSGSEKRKRVSFLFSDIRTQTRRTARKVGLRLCNQNLEMCLGKERYTLSEAVVSLRTVVTFVTWFISKTEFYNSELALE